MIIKNWHNINLTVFLLFLGLSQLSGQEVTNQFDFWVGKWAASWEEPKEQLGKGINILEKTLDGKVIQENFEILEGQSKGFKGTSISVYEVATKTWKQSWADNQGGFYYFKGITDGETRIFQTEAQKLPDGKQVIQRMRFEDIKENSFVWYWESSIDQGETWKLNWKIDYKRL